MYVIYVSKLFVIYLFLVLFTGPISKADNSSTIFSMGSSDPDTAESELTENQKLSNWDQMFKRKVPRSFERYPEDVIEYIKEGDGWYIQINSTTVWQWASESLEERDDLLNTAYNFSGGWQPFYKTYISWWVSGGLPIGAPKSANLSKSIGSGLDVNGSLESNEIFLAELYLVQGIGEKIRLSLGWIDSSWRYDFNTAANDSASQFLAMSLINSPAIPFPEQQGLGMDILLQPKEWLDIHMGLYQTNCSDDKFACFSKLSNDAWFSPLEIILKSYIPGLGSGDYRILGFASHNSENRGLGFSLSFDQQMGSFIPFIRIGFADKDISEFKRFYSFGIEYTSPLGRAWDAIGLGFARGLPSDPGRRNESIVEFYWRVQINPLLSLSPDLQLVFDPADNPFTDRLVVLGMRMQWDF